MEFLKWKEEEVMFAGKLGASPLQERERGPSSCTVATQLLDSVNFPVLSNLRPAGRGRFWERKRAACTESPQR